MKAGEEGILDKICSLRRTGTLDLKGGKETRWTGEDLRVNAVKSSVSKVGAILG